MNLKEFVERYNRIVFNERHEAIVNLVAEFTVNEMNTTVYYLTPSGTKKITWRELLDKARNGEEQAIRILQHHIENWLKLAKVINQ
jgi:hypothetical protein